MTGTSTVQHVWNFEVWTAAQMAMDPRTVQGCAQVPGRSGRITAATGTAAREIASAALAPGDMIGAGQHLRYECCRAVIRNGSVVKYRTMGKATVRFHECEDSMCVRREAHRYLVHFRTGRYAGTSRHVWLTQDDVTEAAV